MDDILTLLKECENDKGSEEFAAELKKAKIGNINLKAYLQQVDIADFANSIKNEFQFKIGCTQGFGPWLDGAEKHVNIGIEKPKDFNHAKDCEEKACAFLKQVVKANKSLKTVQAAGDGIRGNMEVQEAMSRLQERYYVLCKKAEQKVKNINHLLIEWKRLDDFLAPTNPYEMDDFTPKQLILFLKTYAMYYG
jgi:hypothetical protein